MSAANGSAPASARSAEATAAGLTPWAVRSSISRAASGWAKMITAIAATIEEITTGTIVARMIAGIRRSACRILSLAMK